MVMAPPNSSSFSVSVVLPASGWEMMAKVRRRAISCWRSMGLPERAQKRSGFWPLLSSLTGRVLEEQGRHHERDRGQQLDEHMEGRARGVLEGIAHRVPHDRG